MVASGLYIFLLIRSIHGQLGAEPADAANVAKSVGTGNLSTRIDLEPGDSTSLMAQLKFMQENLTKVVTNVRQGSESLATASNEQSLGVAQVGEAVSQMDQVTQQNAALVEEMAAAASSLKSQAQELVHTVAVFQLGDSAPRTGVSAAPMRAHVPKLTSAPRPVAKPPAVRIAAPAPKKVAMAALPKPAPKVSAKATPAGGDDDWETF